VPEPGSVTGIDLVANNAQIGGGEVMLLRMASTARDLGVDVRVVGPDFDPALGDAATAAGLPFVGVPGRDRRAYAAHLAWLSRAWHTRLVWCNGLVPALATARCRAPRVVHLHQMATGHQARAVPLAVRGAAAVVLPSTFLWLQMPEAAGRATRTLENWTDDAKAPGRTPLSARPTVVGFLGRVAPIKGVDVLADALAQLEQRRPGHFELVIAGDERFVAPDDAAALAPHLDACAGVTTRLGWVEPDAFFEMVDVVVVPSVWDEPFGLVAVETMARGVPLIVSDRGALPAIVGPAHPWIVPAGDATALAAAIEAVAADPERARAVATDALARWEAQYSPRAGRRRYAALLRALGVRVDG
jgi:glycosyltransferase involved in cell wall biosynthesis